MRLLFAWIGHSDLRAVTEPTSGSGPIAQALAAVQFDVAYLLDNYTLEHTSAWRTWLSHRTNTKLHVRTARLTGPTEFAEIYREAVAAVTEARRAHGNEAKLCFHLSPGTPAMAAVWLLLAKARFGAELVETSREQGFRTVDVPFDIAADFLPDLLRKSDARVAAKLASESPKSARFGDIVYRSEGMSRTVLRAQKVALRSVPVLILGESGTGKELLARAIHAAGPRKDRPFLAINCGAIPEELVESELFGHERGAFTGAVTSQAGVFERAHGGTLLLDEVGELPLAVQVKLLRVLQEHEVLRVGSTKTRSIDVRILAATHRDLTAAAAAGQFREDLYYRLAVAVLHLPPLRERAGDLPLLIDHLWRIVTSEAQEDRSWQHKELSVGARQALMRHSWPGNIRELLNTLHRLALWSEGDVVTTEDVQDALANAPARGNLALNQTLGNGFSLPDALANLARHYLERALAEAGGNKTRAAQLVGLASYQTLTNWMEKYGVSEQLQT